MSFSESLTEEFEYLSYQEESSSGNNEDLVTKSLSKQSNTSLLNSKNNTVGNFGKSLNSLEREVEWCVKCICLAAVSGGLGSYTPSKIGDTSFQLGVSRQHVPPSAPARKSKGAAAASGVSGGQLRPAEDAVSWSGSSTTSDILF